jgi:uroporphyrin-III C-methyltransferase/precorrin-2 dehydrogenase/sirohydrochlorin ferrochelatase
MSDYSAYRPSAGQRGGADNNGATGPLTGRVALVGAGPGDPELLTIRAARLIAAAEVVFVDRLVGKGVIDLISPSAQVVSVGKSKGEHSVPQEEIHRRMIEAAKAGKRVVRLKGGDPFIFGRGGEELEALRAADIEVEVVPGISAALGVAAVAQIPLTHRDAAQAVTFVTGHAALGKEPDLDWTALARPNQTVVVFMGVGAADVIAARLIAAGRDPATPVAIVENGTRENEVRAFGALGNAADVIQAAGIQGPALLVIGEVVALAQREAGAAAMVRASRTTPTLSSLWEMLS